MTKTFKTEDIPPTGQNWLWNAISFPIRLESVQ